MSGTIVGICTAVLFAHDGITAWEPPLGGWVVIPSTAVHVGWLYNQYMYLYYDSYNNILYYGTPPLKIEFYFIKDKINSDRLRKLCANCLVGTTPWGLGCYPLCTHVVVYKYRYWVGFAHPVPLSLSVACCTW